MNRALVQLSRKRLEIVDEAREVLDNLTTATSEDDVRELSRKHDVVMREIDLVDLDIAQAKIDAEEEEERARRRPISEGGEQRGQAEGYVRSEGRTWEDRNGQEIKVLAPSERLAQRSDDYEGPSLGSIMRAMITGPRNEEEQRALAEGTDSAGGYTVPTPLASEFIDRLRAASVCIRAGAQTVPMDSKTLRIARLESDPTVAWRAENATIAESDATFGAVDFDAKSLMGITVVSRELLEDSVNVAEMLEIAFVNATAVTFDQGLLFGSGSSNEPTGLANAAGLTQVDMAANGAALANYDKIIDTIYAIQALNAEPTSMIYHPRTGASLAKLKDANSNPLSVPQMVANLQRYPTTSVSITETQGTATGVTSSILVGDFRKMLIGLRAMLRIEVLKERYADKNQYGFVWGMRGDVQFEQINAFARLRGITA